MVWIFASILAFALAVMIFRCWRSKQRLREIMASLAAEKTRSDELNRRHLAEQEQHIAEMSKREAMLALAEKRHRMLTDACPLGILSADTETAALTYANPAACRLLGYTADELMNMSVMSLHPPSVLERVRLEFQAMALLDYREVPAITYQRKDGSTFLADIATTTAILRGRRIVTAFITDITERHQAEERQKNMLMEAEAARRALLSVLEDQKRSQAERDRLALAIEYSAESVVITDPSGVIQYVNPAFTRVSGYTREEAIGQHTRLLKSGRQNEEFYGELWRTITSGNVWSGRLINRTKHGTFYTEDVTISPVLDAEKRIVNFVAVKRDITRELHAEQQLAQSQKMEVVGRLAGGIAHDFNNILQTIFGCVDLAALEDDSTKLRDHYLPEIRTAAKSAAALTRQLLAFSRRQVLEKRHVNLNDLIENMSRMIERLIGEDIRLLISLQPHLPTTWVDPGQIEQIIMNITVNARDAMPEGGQFSISTTLVEFTAEDVEMHPDAQVGRFIKIALTDSGVGMTEVVKKRIFEPFFTTKPTGKGTGLGLSTVYGVVKQHEGWISVYSEPGQGSAFHVYLPVRDMEAVDSKTRVPSEHLPRGKGERILLVEDEDRVRDLMLRILVRHGYKVNLADTAENALEIFERANGEFDLICSDVVLPGKSGFDLAEELKRRSPNLKVLMVSGYTDERTRWPKIKQKGWHYLQKPVTREMLLGTIHMMLNPSDRSDQT